MINIPVGLLKNVMISPSPYALQSYLTSHRNIRQSMPDKTFDFFVCVEKANQTRFIYQIDDQIEKRRLRQFDNFWTVRILLYERNNC